MSLYVLDTDILTLARQHHPAVLRRLLAHAHDDLAITVITVEETLMGWMAYIRAANRPDRVAYGYAQFAGAVPFLASWSILPYPEIAITRFEQLRKMRLNVAPQDLRIAAIVLEAGGILASRNLRDFQRVPGLLVEDWAA